MTNEEKAREIANEYCYWDDRDESGAVKVAIEMAEWKDKQFKEYLEKKKATLMYISVWVARNKNNTLTLFKSKPVRSSIRMTNKTKGDCEYGKTTKCDYWDEAVVFDGYDKWVNLNEYFDIDESLFPDLKWEDEPLEVDLCEHGLQEKYEQLKNEYDTIKMGEWKDKQFKEYLEKRKTLYEGKEFTVDTAITEELNEIINELFKGK